MSTRSIPQIDLTLIKNDKDLFLKRLRHALIEYGAFALTSIDEHFDSNIYALLLDQSTKFFNESQKRKEKISMKHTNSFLGYTVETVQTTRQSHTIVEESIELCSGGSQDGIRSPYRNIVCDNMYPKEGRLPHFKRAVEHFIPAMADFSNMLTGLALESLDIHTSPAMKYINEGEQYYRASIRSQYTPPSSEKNLAPYRLSQDPSLLTFIYYPATSKPSVQFHDIFGELLDAPSLKTDCIIVTVGLLLEYITQRTCMSSYYRYAPPDDFRVIIPFHQYAALGHNLEQAPISKELIELRNKRDKLRSQVSKGRTLGASSNVAKLIFERLLIKFKDVSQTIYPKELEAMEVQLRKIQEDHDREAGEELDTLAIRLHKVFIALDQLIFMNIPTRTADIKLFTLLPQIKILTGQNVYLSDLFKVFYIWPDFVSLKVNDENEVVVDVDETKDMLDMKSLLVRGEEFAQRMEKWFTTHEGLDVPSLDLKSIPRKGINGNVTKKRARVEILQKSTVKKQKKETGLSLLERIRKKESENLENQVDPKVKYAAYLDGKISQVLDIVASMRPDKPHSVDGLTEQVKNSLKMKHALASKESRDLVIHLNTKFPDVFKLFHGKEVSVLRWKDFDVNEVKRRLK